MAILLVSAVPGYSQLISASHSPSYYLGGIVSQNYSKASIDARDGSILCGVFTQGYHYGLSPQAGAIFPLSSKWSFESKLWLSNLSTNFHVTAHETVSTPRAYDPKTGQLVAIQRDRFFDASLSLLSISALMSNSPLPHLTLSAGPSAGFFVRHSFSETEQITSPSNAVYVENNRTVRTISDGPLPINALQAGIELGVSYELPFQPSLWLRPALSSVIPITSISPRSTEAWHVYPVSASLSLLYRAPEPIQVAPSEPLFAMDSLLVVPHPRVPSEPVKKKSVLQVSIKAFGVLDDGTETPEPVLSIERMHVTEVYPMLHYVFFDDGSAEIPTRYQRESVLTKASFNEKSLFTSNALEIHHHVLDILGHRLADNPKSSVTLLGTRSEHSPLDSAKGISVARGRAESVADYLRDVWGISPERLHIRARSLPDAPSDDHNPSGEAENRRVEIVPSSPDIVAPLWTERIERVATPPRIDFTPEIITEGGVRSATIIVRQGDRILQTFDALTGSSTGEYMWTLSGPSMPERGDSLNYTFEVVDSLGNTATSKGIILLRQETHDVTQHARDTAFDKDLERFSLILFDYSSSQLDKRQSDRILREMAASIHDASAITLTGHTDRTGDDLFNSRLALQRVSHAADMLGEELKKLGKERPAMLVESHGSRDQLFDNSIPEGRVLSRTVRALIENEAK